MDSLTQKPPTPSGLGAPQRNPQRVLGAGLPGSSQYPEEITQEREKAPGKPAWPLQGRPAQGDTGQGSALLLVCQMAQGGCFWSTQQKGPLISSAEPP